MGRFDWTLFHLINGQAGKHDWLDDFGQTLAERLAIAIAATLVIGWLLSAGAPLLRNRRLPRTLVACVFAVGISLGVALLMNNIIGHTWFRERPYADHPRAHLLGAPSADPSFASDHATAGFALSFGALVGLPRVAVLIFLETLLMSLARVYVGQHYPGDIAGGLALGGMGALVASWIVRRSARIIDGVASFVNDYAGRHGWPVRMA